MKPGSVAFVRLGKGAFIGRDALATAREGGTGGLASSPGA